MSENNVIESVKIKKDLILYGAYDRYNYGDNLMPIIYQLYIEKYFPNILDDYEVKYCAIGKSDLSRFECYPTSKIHDFLESSPDDSVLVVVGGEVLCATNLTLLLHMQNSRFSHSILKVARNFLRSYLNLVTNKFYGTPWEFPYIPPKTAFKNRVKLAFNTVGGGLSGLSTERSVEVIDRLNSADYISVRDKRTEMQLQGKVPTKLYPDSVFLISELITFEFLDSRVNINLKKITDNSYFCFQASPHKVGEDIDKVVANLTEISKQRKEEIVLLPIGYASGHDDRHYLTRIEEKLPRKTLNLSNLNVWEIMYVIKKANLFIGTSLHGVITAMAFGIPHFGLNPNIDKVDSFLKDWSIFPFNKSLNLGEIVTESTKILSIYEQQLYANSVKLSDMVKENNQNIVKLCQ